MGQQTPYSIRVISGGVTGIFSTVAFDSGTFSTSTAVDGTPEVILHGLGGPGGTVLKVITAADTQTNNINTLIFNTGTQSTSGSSSTLFGLGSGGGGGSGIVNWYTGGVFFASSSNANFVAGTGLLLAATGSITNTFAIDPAVVATRSSLVTNFNGSSIGFAISTANGGSITVNNGIPFAATFDNSATFNGAVVFNNTATYSTTIYNVTDVTLGTNFIYYTGIQSQVLNLVYQTNINTVASATNVLYNTGTLVIQNSNLMASNAASIWFPHFYDSGYSNLIASGTWDFTGATLLGVGTVGGADLTALSNTLNATMLSTAAVLQAAINTLPAIATLNNASNTLVALQLSSNAVLQAAVNALPNAGSLTALSNTLLSVTISNGVTGAAWLNGTVTISNNASITSTLFVHQLQADSITANGTSTFQSLNTVTGPATMTWGSPTQSGTVETSGSAIILHQAAPTFSGYEILVRPSDIFGWVIGAGSTSSNNIVPVYWSTTTAGGDTLALGFTSTDTGTLNARYAYAVLPIPSLAQGWAAGTGLVIRVVSSSPSLLTNTLNVRITSPTGNQFTTNNLISPASGIVSDYFIATGSLPAFASATTNDWTVRFDFQARNSATQAIVAIRGRFQ